MNIVAKEKAGVIASALTAYATIVGVGAAIAYYLFSTVRYLNLNILILIEMIYMLSVLCTLMILKRIMI